MYSEKEKKDTEVEKEEELKDEEVKVQPNGRIITSELVRYYKWDEEMTEKAKQAIAEAEAAKKA
jgi:hypothetical protein